MGCWPSALVLSQLSSTRCASCRPGHDGDAAAPSELHWNPHWEGTPEVWPFEEMYEKRSTETEIFSSGEDIFFFCTAMIMQ